MIRNIVFDWSGTLSDDFEIVYHTLCAMLHDLDSIPPTFSRFQEVITIPLTACLQELFASQPLEFAKCGDAAKLQHLFVKHFRAYGFPSPLAGVQAVLGQLKQKGFPMAVFSSHHQRFLEEENHLYFQEAGFFTLLFGSAGDKRLSVSRLLAQTGFAPHETLFVGDTSHDIIVGRSVGMRTAAVLSGYHSKEKLAAALPDFMLNSVCELPRIL